ncbi:MAG: MBL fold metallo-hydrolase [Oscillospiraceae bacterium]|nr:MBL fold metallo-hydrolase [Oscillospiraceae bacterium]
MTQNYVKTLIHEKTWLILEFGYDAIYYLEGEDRGLLIDTGIGGGDLKSYIAEFATKPYDVVLTHGHLDHVGAICQYPEIYVNHEDWGMIERTSNDARRVFIENLDEMSIHDVPDQDASCMCEFSTDKLPVFRDLNEYDVFDLGGRKVTAYSLPGHTEGCMCLYDDFSNSLFAGDTIIQRLLLVSGPKDYVERLKRWKEAAERIVISKYESYNGVYLGHYGRASNEMIDTIYTIANLLIEDIGRLNEFDGEHFMIGKYQIALEMNLKLK